LSSFELIVYKQKSHLKGKGYDYSHIYHMLIDNTICYGCVRPIPEDKLVLMALGRMINHKFLDLKLFNVYSFGYKTRAECYHAHILSMGRDKISKVYRINMSNTIRKINKDLLLTKLENIVSNEDIMKLIKEFLYIPVIVKDRGLPSKTMRVDAYFTEYIQSAGLLTNVLLNYWLIDFDHKFQNLFPSFSYARYGHEIIVCTSQVESKFEDMVFSLFDDLNLEGKIESIVPGGNPMHFEGGLIWVSEDGQIKMMTKIVSPDEY